MGFARGLAMGMRQLPSVLLHNQEQAKQKKLGLAMAGMTRGMEQETEIRDQEADPNFMGPPRAPLDGSEPAEGVSRREAARVGTHDIQAGMARVYAEHGRPDAAATMLSRSAASRERQDERGYQRGRDAKADERLSRRDEREERAAAQEQMIRQGRMAYRSLVEGNTETASRIFAANGDYLAQELGLGEDRKVVGVTRAGDRISLMIENANTKSTGPMTERGSADQDDQVVNLSLSEFGSMVGVEPDRRVGKPQTQEGMGIGQFGPDGRWLSITSAKDLKDLKEAGGKGGAASIDSADAKRVLDRARTGVQDVMRTHLGEQFMGDPESAQVHAMASEAAYGITDYAYQNGLNFAPERVGNFAAQIALTPRYAGLKNTEAVKLAEAERSELPRSERGDVDVEARARAIQNELAIRHQQEVMTSVFGQPESFGAVPEGVEPAPEDEQAASGQPQPQSAATAGQPQPDQTAQELAPVTGPSPLERLNRHSAAREAGTRVRESVLGHLSNRREERQAQREEWLEQNPYEKQRQESIGNPIENVGAAYGAARNFVSGVVGSDQPAPPQEAAAQFFEVIRSGEQPTPEMVEAAVLYEKENPGVLSAAERQHLRAQVQRLLAEAG